MTTGKAYSDFVKELQRIYDQREADNIADWVFEKITGLNKMNRRINANVILDQKKTGELKKSLSQLLQHKPVQYVLEEAWFFKRKFFVNENVLIPRPETEELVEWILNDLKEKLVESKALIKILDIGTGSGCIAISLKKELNNCQVSALDASDEALEVARKNARDLNAVINFSLMNFLNETEWDQLEKFDLIVSNPPYIPKSEKDSLAKNVTENEPSIALFVEDEDPFIFYKKIAAFGKDHLKTEGKIYVEVHEEYARKVQQVFEKAAFTSKIKKDIYGKERMVKAF
ncbi:MAG TPA: peptide chain release factor N(5)-glutamine methyltransferase [Hanamia sp.]|nr:peptide chain release factor N(5)-glutamine methyltransferase [Hanamia sp.]